MEIHQQTTKSYFKMLSIIHLFLVLGIVLFGLVVIFIITDFQHPDNDSGLAKLFVYLVPGMVIAGIVASNMISTFRLNALKENNDLNVKLKGYSEVLIIRYMLLEFPSLFALVVIFMTSNMNYLVYAGLLVVLLIIKRPTIKLAIADLKPDQKEISFLEDPNSIIN
jgi:energy-coupling factor transporter transmembrane protein EcfT